MALWAMSEDMRRALLSAAGCDPDIGLVALDAVEVAWLLDGVDETDVMGVEVGCGRVAWCKRMGTSPRWTVLAVAPVGSRFPPGRVNAADMFSSRWPADWVTRVRMQTGAAAAPPEAAPEVGGFCVGALGRVGVQLARIEGVHEGRIARVRLRPADADIPADGIPEVREWRVLGKYLDGYAAIWRGGQTTLHNFRLLAMLAANRQRAADLAAGKNVPKLARRKRAAPSA